MLNEWQHFFGNIYSLNLIIKYHIVSILLSEKNLTLSDLKYTITAGDLGNYLFPEVFCANLFKLKNFALTLDWCSG